jgi:hypothetical protein
MACAASPRITRRPVVQRDRGIPLTRGHLMVVSIMLMIFSILDAVSMNVALVFH